MMREEKTMPAKVINFRSQWTVTWTLQAQRYVKAIQRSIYIEDYPLDFLEGESPGDGHVMIGPPASKTHVAIYKEKRKFALVLNGDFEIYEGLTLQVIHDAIIHRPRKFVMNLNICHRSHLSENLLYGCR
jgi:hypothetical protein